MSSLLWEQHNVQRPGGASAGPARTPTIPTASGGPPDSTVAPETGATEFASFCGAVEALLTGTAAGKSYNKTGTEGPNPLYEFVRGINSNDAHALGEIIYKIKRFAAKGNVEDILKAAAWCFLIYKYNAKRDSQDDRTGLIYSVSSTSSS